MSRFYPCLAIALFVLPLQAQVTNKMCPVMTDQPTRADRFVDYQGKRIYFCCDKCIERFKREPAKFIGNVGGSPVVSSASSATEVAQPLPASKLSRPAWK